MKRRKTRQEMKNAKLAANVERRAKLIQTIDNWCPNIDGDKVKATFISSLKLHRVCVWGNDDLGMEKDFKTRMEALLCWQNLPDVVSFDSLKEMGFQPA